MTALVMEVSGTEGPSELQAPEGPHGQQNSDWAPGTFQKVPGRSLQAWLHAALCPEVTSEATTRRVLGVWPPGLSSPARQHQMGFHLIYFQVLSKNLFCRIVISDENDCSGNL